MDQWIKAVASPYTAGETGAKALAGHRARLGQALAKNLLERLGNNLDKSEILQKYLPALAFATSSCNGQFWGPEIPSLISWLAKENAAPPIFEMEVYVLRATREDTAGCFSDTRLPGVGHLNGIPKWRLANRYFERTSGIVTLPDLKIDSDRSTPLLAATVFNGSASDFIRAVFSDTGVAELGENRAPKDISHRIHLALSLLHQTGVPLDWILSAITCLYITDSENPFSRSGSWDRHFGISYFSDRDDPYSIADVLLHEAAHQNFYLANLDGCLADDDGVLRISPAVNQGRPLWALLLAYHAFANVAIFFSKINPRDAHLVRASAARSFDYAVKLEAILDDIEAKPVFAALYQTLRAELESSSLACKAQFQA